MTEHADDFSKMVRDYERRKKVNRKSVKPVKVDWDSDLDSNGYFVVDPKGE